MFYFFQQQVLRSQQAAAAAAGGAGTPAAAAALQLQQFQQQQYQLQQQLAAQQAFPQPPYVINTGKYSSIWQIGLDLYQILICSIGLQLKKARRMSAPSSPLVSLLTMESRPLRGACTPAWCHRRPTRRRRPHNRGAHSPPPNRRTSKSTSVSYINCYIN